MWETIRGYLTFTRKERYGVLFLLLLVSILFVLPFFKPSTGDPDPGAYQNMKEGIRKFESRIADSAGDSDNHHRYREQPGDESTNDPSNVKKPLAPELFYFDPNQNSASDWQRLGLTHRLSNTISLYWPFWKAIRKYTD
jgi:hypothetical protein